MLSRVIADFINDTQCRVSAIQDIAEDGEEAGKDFDNLIRFLAKSLCADLRMASECGRASGTHSFLLSGCEEPRKNRTGRKRSAAHLPCTALWEKNLETTSTTSEPNLSKWDEIRKNKALRLVDSEQGKT